MAARLYMWCCRRVQRRDSDGSPGAGEGPEGDSDQQGKKSGRSRSFFSRSLGSNLPSKKKRKHDKEKAGKPEDGDVGDLSVVKRETEVLRSYQRAPPPKNRARASRVPRALKSQNVTTNNIFQEVDETELQEEKTQSPSEQSTTNSATPGTTEDKSQPNTLVPSDDVDLPKTTSAETEAPRSTEGEDSQDNLASSEKDTVPKSSDAEAVAETATLEPSQPASEEAGVSESPQTAEDAASESVKNEEVSVKPDSDDSLTEEAKGDGPCKPEQKDSVTKETKDEASPKSEHEGSSMEQSKNNDASDVGDEGGDDGSEQEGTDPSPEQEKKDEQTDVSALMERDTSDASNTSAEEDGGKKIPRRPASYSEYSSSAPKPAAIRGKRFTVPSAHGEGMDQLLESLQTRLKEDGIPVGTADQELSQNTESSEEKPAEGAQSQSDADQQQDVKVDAVDESPPTSEDTPL